MDGEHGIIAAISTSSSRVTCSMQARYGEEDEDATATADEEPPAAEGELLALVASLAHSMKELRCEVPCHHSDLSGPPVCGM
jgi:hypothetical protein